MFFRWDFALARDTASAMSYSIRLSKENFKFSAAHFTIFGPGKGERLHGHNYYVGAEISIQKLQTDIGMAFDFNLIKPALARICKELDEYVLIAGDSTYLTIQGTGPNSELGAGPDAPPNEQASIAIQFGTKRYSLPSEDVKVLPVCNITSEELAAWIGQKFLRDLLSLIPNVVIEELSLSVEETRGQCVIWRAPLDALTSVRKTSLATPSNLKEGI